MPRIEGPEFVRRVRSPGVFPLPNVPIIMLTGHGERSRVLEAVRLGVHEFLLKPVSSSSLQARILSVLTKPRTMVKRGDYYGPEPRKMASYKPESDSFKPEPETTKPQADARKLEAPRPVDRRPNHMIFVN
jgi:DNA-binding response OmpR family regulator